MVLSVGMMVRLRTWRPWNRGLEEKWLESPGEVRNLLCVFHISCSFLRNKCFVSNYCTKLEFYSSTYFGYLL